MTHIPDPARSVTIKNQRIPSPGKEKEFEEALDHLVNVGNTYEGHLGGTIFRPQNMGEPYQIIFKFDTEKNFEIWDKSEDQRRAEARVLELSKGGAEVEINEAINAWFNSMLPSAKVIPKYKIAIITWIAIYVLIFLVELIFGHLLSEVFLPLGVFIETVVVVCLMVYLIMPRMMIIFSNWLRS